MNKKNIYFRQRRYSINNICFSWRDLNKIRKFRTWGIDKTFYIRKRWRFVCWFRRV